ncbi:MAG: exosome complex protein Rrp42 [Nanoarchaeota archaeon]|nr:exosome complex protein Rrp42 [Nanoarchaeota archaeon]MBU4086329.1 exosome complex protein Rrp42 [Nanoarchaeota archaeon]
MMVSNLTKQRIHDYLKEGKRFDNRGLLDYRELEIETGISINAEGSARVRLGKTEIVAGVKLGVAEPYTDHEDEGTFITTLELVPTASPKFESGPPRIEAIEMARIVDRTIRESKYIDFKKLCIKKGEKVWSVMLDLFSMNDDGNLLDVACIAAVAALKDAKIPVFDEESGRVKFGEWTEQKLPLAKEIPLLFTFHKIGDSVIVDPVVEEEESSDARISLGLLDGKINALQKGNSESFELEGVYSIFEESEKKYKEMSKKVEENIDKAIKRAKGD